MIKSLNKCYELIMIYDLNPCLLFSEALTWYVSELLHGVLQSGNEWVI